MKNFLKIAGTLIIALCLSLVVTSCQGKIGYGLVLWNISDAGISDGEIVPVYVKSNVFHIYIIGNPHNGEKVEVPFWQITEPQSKGKTKKIKAKYSAYENTYARCLLDGLPVRGEASNMSKQVYRLRRDEILRILYETDDGGQVRTGDKDIEGKWVKVIASDGTDGWCFSHNLRMFKMNADGAMASNQDVDSLPEVDIELEKILSTKWYPANYRQMIESGEINLKLMNEGFGFDTGKNSGKVQIKLPDFSCSYDFTGLTKIDDGIWKYNDAPIQLHERTDTRLVVKYYDNSGSPVSYTFIAFAKNEDGEETTNISEIINAEKARRDELYSSLKNFGPVFKSKNYGTITFMENNAFNWINFKMIVPSVIDSGATGEGRVSFDYFISDNLKNSWDGVISFKFNGMEKEVRFLYKMESTGLRLENASKAPLDEDGYTVTAHAVSPLVMFFAK